MKCEEAQNISTLEIPARAISASSVEVSSWFMYLYVERTRFITLEMSPGKSKNYGQWKRARRQ
jgi:hypothetical protein